MLRRHLGAFEASRVAHRFTDVLILGTGVAGLSAALAATAGTDTDKRPGAGTQVLLVAKAAPEETATRWAQGGVAAVVQPERTGDSVELHVADTLDAAAGLGDREAARVTAAEGVERVRALSDLGAEWDREPGGEVHLTLEGAHSRPRILHRGDATGQELERVLLQAALGRPTVSILANTFGVDLLRREGRVVGALLLRPHGELEVVWARQTVLASGGLGRLYRETTNPAVATGDGMAMAFRAGALLQDLEFVQFHPTTLYVAGADRFLISEAVRGEGAILRDSRGEAFMKRFHPLADLAPRDVVSRAIVSVLRGGAGNKVYLDLSPIPRERIVERFPKIRAMLAGFGIDILREPIPVRPSAHYSIGGVQTDLHGRTSLPGLMAAGEVACTSLHGANRLASNSLLEGLVFGHRAGRAAALEAASGSLPEPFSLASETSKKAPPAPALDLDDLMASLRSLVWQQVGIERTELGLRAALEQIASWIPYGLGSDFFDTRGWTLQNTLQSAYLLTYAALRRRESRGVHFRVDYPERDDAAWGRHLTLSRNDWVEESG